MSKYYDRILDPELNSCKLEDRSTGITVGTFTNGGLTEQRAALIGMSLARFSRSAESLTTNAKAIRDASAAMEKVAVGYGHASVSGMAHINFHVEDVSILDSLRFFYSTDLLDGQERSTRFQDFDRFLAIPSTIGSNSIRNRYKSIVRQQITNYKEMFDPTYNALKALFPSTSESTLVARTLDCTRYLIPLATKTSYGAVMSARTLSQYVSRLGASKDPVQAKLCELLKDLFTDESEDYKSDCSFLMKHCEPSPSMESIIEFLRQVKDNKQVRGSVPDKEPNVIANSTLGHSHLLKLIDPSILDEVQLEDEEEAVLGMLLANTYNHHVEMPSFFREGLVEVRGFADIGTIKDLNRHRSLCRFVPFLHESTSMESELIDRPLGRRFFINPYLNYNSDLYDLSEQYFSLLKSTYKEIEKWYVNAKEEIPDHADLYAKRLVPQAHATSFVYSGSLPDFNYMINLRTRPGGHIQYRMLTHAMIDELRTISNIFDGLRNIPKPDPTSEEEFGSRK